MMQRFSDWRRLRSLRAAHGPDVADDQQSGSSGYLGLEVHADKCDNDAAVMFDGETSELGGATVTIAVN